MTVEKQIFETFCEFLNKTFKEDLDKKELEQNYIRNNLKKDKYLLLEPTKAKKQLKDKFKTDYEKDLKLIMPSDELHKWHIKLFKEKFLDEYTKKQYFTHTVKFRSATADATAYVDYIKSNDGFVYTENSHVPLDFNMRNATTVVIKFLNYKLEGKYFYNHIQENTSIAQYIFNQLKSPKSCIEVANEISNKKSPFSNSPALPQIYMKNNDTNENPLDNYNIVSILPNSGLAMATDDLIKKYFKKPNDCYITNSSYVTRNFPSKPRNISAGLGSKLSIKALRCSPKCFEENYTKTPVFNFFKESIYFRKKTKNRLKELLNTNVFKTRLLSARIINDLVDECLEKRAEIMYRMKPNWTSDTENFNLAHQAFWLDSKYDNIRMKEKEKWLEKLAEDFVWSLGKFDANQKDFIKKIFINRIKRGG